MYMYRILLKDVNRRTRILLDPHYMHGFTMLVHNGKREEVNLLWTSVRVDNNRALLVQTDDLVDVSVWNNHENVASVNGPLPLNKILDSISNGDLVYIKLEGSPQIKSHGKLKAINGAEGQLNWLNRKLSSALNVGDVRVTDLGTRESKARNAKWKRVEFEGLCEVTNVDELKKLVHSGIGRGKSFGLGLLQVMPVK